MKAQLLTASNLLFTLTVHATVNLKNASLSEKWIDASFNTFKLQRNYNSRSLYKGFFGFGWCSNIEYQIERDIDGYYTLFHCDNAVSAGHITRKILYKKQKLTFSDQGQLKQIKLENGKILNFFYRDPVFTKSDETANSRSETDPETTLQIFQNRDQTISRIEYKNTVLKYIYSDEDLVQNTNAWKNTYYYHYDEFHNMRWVRYPDGTHKEFYVDPITDRYRVGIDRHGCTTSLKYPDSKKGVYFMAQITTTCEQFDSNTSYFEFWYQKDSSGKDYLEKIRRTAGGISWDFFFTATSDQPVLIENPLSQSKYTLDPSGRLLKHTTQTQSTQYRYSISKKVESVIIKSFQNGTTSTYDYFYDTQGRVTRITDDPDTDVEISYDTHGRVSFIRQGYEGLALEYDEHGNALIKPLNNVIPFTSESRVPSSLNSSLKILLNRLLEPIRTLKNVNKCIKQSIWIYEKDDLKCSL